MGIDGLATAPFAPSPTYLDFGILVHELGHQFGSVHTSSYCPPLDRCAPPSLAGLCQEGRRCITDGTIMSLCVSCTGGFANITNDFHPVVAEVLRTEAEGCLAPFRGVLVQDLGFSLAGPSGTPRLTAELEAGTPDRLRFVVSDAVPGSEGVLYASTKAIFVPHLGGTLVPSRQIALRLTVGADGRASATQELPSDPAPLALFAQAWVQDQRAASASSAIELRILRP
jgi:hypothetical protein